jgi:chorismate lyase/3-hydroxybenzoate synthase
MTTQAPYCITLIPASEKQAALDDPQTFAVIEFGQNTSLTDAAREISVGLPTLGEEYIEVWQSKRPLQRSQDGNISVASCDDFLFGALLVRDNGQDSLAEITQTAYQEIHDLLERRNYPALLRMWNYFPQINTETSGLERYRAFCLGRHQALDAWHFPEEQLPAASAIGTHAEGLLIYFLAGHRPGTQIENPRQVSAFNYPEQYGPKSPSFSRATLIPEWQHLYISGTASIVGHETRHSGDQLAQLHESLKNVQTVIDIARQVSALECTEVKELKVIRVYVRNTLELDRIAQTLKQALGEDIRLQLVQGDICRHDLSLEIEGMYAVC